VTLERKKLFVERGIGIAVLVFVLVAPQFVSGFWTDAILSQSFILGIGAASLVFLSAYGGMISLAQAGLMGIAG
jgi:branched-chain amino acid transport system permease protein